MFQGSSALTLDAKGRISVPAKYRDALISDEQGSLTVTRHPDGCLLIYPRSQWLIKREQIATFPMKYRAMQRLLLGYAQDVEMDSANRILIAPELRQAAALGKDVMLFGLVSHFELWDKATWDKREAEELAAGIDAAMEDFSF